MVEVRVPNLDCDGCAAKIRKALFKIKGKTEHHFFHIKSIHSSLIYIYIIYIGVEEVEIEMEIQKITVRGYNVEEKRVLKAIKRAGKAAEPWPYPGYSSYFASFYKYPSHVVNHYYDTSRNVAASHGIHSFFQTPAVYSVAVASDEAVASLFSDDNPHACSIM